MFGRILNTAQRFIQTIWGKLGTFFEELPFLRPTAEGDLKL